MTEQTRSLYVVVCAAGPARDVGILVGMAQEEGWTVQVIATPAAVGFIDVKALEQQTGRPVRHTHRKPGQPRSPKADAIVVAPATFNTINKLANGIADNYALDVVNEAIGLGVPIVVLPFVNSAYGKRAPFRKNIDLLRREGVSVVFGESRLHDPGEGEASGRKFPWRLAIDSVSSADGSENGSGN
ncbi:flavoprotein [Thermobifida cellulosilytica]|uniref:Flavoprotein n=1 Tax=Thermobifida cellulosilytica TB100 TaxID=665004 RepID=A0A147KLS2_THECS|nr:flavoprotein [Thermobifida cellulosilytica]KUP98247.1 flavoprotein [Thermobifida cellulosilytica TB100]